jgi:hypothetical protein
MHLNPSRRLTTILVTLITLSLSLASIIVLSPTVETEASGTNIVQVVRGNGDWIYTRTSTDGVNWSSWSQPNGKTIDAPSQILFNGNIVQVVRGTGDWIYTRTSADGINWTSWGQPNGKTVDTPSQVEFNGKLIQVVRGTGDWIYTRTSNDGINWTNWSQPNGRTIDTPSQIVFDGKIVQVVRGTSNGIHTRTSTDGTTWSGWSAPIGQTIDSPSQIVFGSQLVQVVRGNQDWIYTRTSNDGINWTNWSQPNGRTIDTPSQIVFDGKIVQVVRGTSNGIHTRTSTDGTTWSGWSPATGKTGSPNPNNFQQFSGEGFKNFYDNYTYSKVNQITTKPPIRYDAAADARIQAIAEGRGYRLRYEASCQCLQTEAANAYNSLRADAAANGHSIVLVSGFRSINTQRGIFTGALGGISNSQIASGQADGTINSILITRSIPGYSKHHTGYTLDFGCNSNNLPNFKNTACYSWLSANNYQNAKRHGFIPSYPEGASNQGPNPEAWEYVWVGTEPLLADDGSYQISQVILGSQLIQTVRGNQNWIYTRTSTDGVNWTNWSQPNGRTIDAPQQLVF